MTRRRLHRKPNRFIRNSKRLVMKRFKLRGGTLEDAKKLSEFQVKIANLRSDSNIIKIKAEIANALKSGHSETVVEAAHNTYTAALTKLIDDTVSVATTTFTGDPEVMALPTKVANLKAMVLELEPDKAKYYELNDIYFMIVELFAQKAMKMMGQF